MSQLTEEQIKKDNPHFGPVIRFIEAEPISGEGDFTLAITVGAHNSKHMGGSRIFDAWATYLWSPAKGWCLGEN
jgi:hypothetical protein